MPAKRKLLIVYLVICSNYASKNTVCMSQ